MKKEFNITGSCNPEWHYMVDTSKRFKAVEDLIEKGKYFTINRARQYGKTTMLQMIRRKMSDRYLVIPLSFEGMDDGAFTNHEAFVSTFSKMMARRLSDMSKVELVGIWKDGKGRTLDDLSMLIVDFCRASAKPGLC